MEAESAGENVKIPEGCEHCASLGRRVCFESAGRASHREWLDEGDFKQTALAGHPVRWFGTAIAAEPTVLRCAERGAGCQ
jgi:hypothetical protein